MISMEFFFPEANLGTNLTHTNSKETCNNRGPLLVT